MARFFFQLFQSAAELVGARRGLGTAADAVQTADDVVDFLSRHQAADALRLPLQPPTKNTCWMTSFSSAVTSIILEQVPCV